MQLTTTDTCEALSDMQRMTVHCDGNKILAVSMFWVQEFKTCSDKIKPIPVSIVMPGSNA